MGKKRLVIVESPTKIKALKSYLGDEYVIEASMGHVIDLPSGAMGVDVENDFTPKYVVLPAKRKVMKQIESQLSDIDEIWLATDPDREGEAISWHLAREIGKNKKIFRVEFHEITKGAILESFKHPREIDMKLVNSQQARRILDRIVGYTISPLLWEKVTKGLSAGRVQSVAVRIIVERENEIRAFVTEEYWSCKANLEVEKEETYTFEATVDKYQDKKLAITNKEEADKIVADLKDAKYVVKDIKCKKRTKNVTPPYTTSKLQQDAFNVLKFPVNKTMKVAQELYEGIEIPGEEGIVGLITYMRTDSVKVSKQAEEQVREFIQTTCGEKYLPEKPNVFKSKKSAQEAHEAIRPTSVMRRPQDLEEYLSKDQLKLYDLIWRKFVASQMTPAQIEQTSIEIGAGEYLLKTTGSVIIFEGFLKIFDAAKAEKDIVIIPPLEVDDPCKLLELLPKQHFTKPPARYSDASLVKILEELGIGRPSTYAPTILTIIGRNYVERRTGYLHPTELGEAVSNLLVENFPIILDPKFTAHFEEELDEIEEGKMEWIAVLKEFYVTFIQQFEKAKAEMKSLKKDPEQLDEKCPKCNRPLIVRWGRHGKFISCSGFPYCRFSRSITSDMPCPEEDCDGFMVKRRSKRGRIFWGCSNYPKCTHITNKFGVPGKKAEIKTDEEKAKDEAAKAKKPKDKASKDEKLKAKKPKKTKPKEDSVKGEEKKEAS